VGHSTSTHTRTHLKPIPVLMGVGTRGYGYGYRWVMQVWKPVWVGTMGLHQHRPLTIIIAPRFHPVSSCLWRWLGVLLWWWWWRPCSRYCHLCVVLHRSICTHNPPYEQWLVGMGAGAVPFLIIVGGCGC
jgi:hypothetical protein